jgi:hypothetical protein
MNKPNFTVPVAIDPLAVLLPDHIYVKIIEWLDPHEPLIKVIERAVAEMTPTDKEFTLNRVKYVTEYAEAVAKAVRKTKA